MVSLRFFIFLLILWRTTILPLAVHASEPTDSLAITAETAYSVSCNAVSTTWNTSLPSVGSLAEADSTQLLSPLSSTALPPNHWRAVGECLAAHLSIWGYAHFIQKADFAQLSWASLRNNLRLHPWVWDGDLIYVNFFDHPYHGNLYFNAARSNNVHFWTSASYSTVGAFLWEVVGERELLSFNDWVSTSFGGIALGEASYRASDLLIDHRKCGWSRCISEIGAGIINPMRLLNRLLTGEAWQSSPQRKSFRPAHYRVDYHLGWQTQQSDATPTRHSSFVRINLSYGTPIDTSQKTKPYDYFDLSLGLGKDGHRNSVNQLRLTARLKTWHSQQNKLSTEIGLYQHFNYLYSSPNQAAQIPYRLAESASIGPAFRVQWKSPHFQCLQSIYPTAVLMGAIMSDHAPIHAHKNYNFASGFALRLQTELTWNARCKFLFDLHHYRLYTWADQYNQGQMGIQGDRSAASLWILSPSLQWRLNKHWHLVGSGRFFHRNSNYAILPDRKSQTIEWQLGLAYSLGQ